MMWRGASTAAFWRNWWPHRIADWEAAELAHDLAYGLAKKPIVSEPSPNGTGKRARRFITGAPFCMQLSGQQGVLIFER
jgi:hypothetical protein